MDENDDRRCANCRYFIAADAMGGACHRYPPIFAGDSSPRESHHWRFPTVTLHAWCGEFLLKLQISSRGGKR